MFRTFAAPTYARHLTTLRRSCIKSFEMHNIFFKYIVSPWSFLWIWLKAVVVLSLEIPVPTYSYYTAPIAFPLPLPIPKDPVKRSLGSRFFSFFNKILLRVHTAFPIRCLSRDTVRDFILQNCLSIRDPLARESP